MMVHWYHDLYMDESVQKNMGRAKKRVERCLGSLRNSLKIRNKSYYAILLAANPDNLFEIIETRQLFFRRYRHLDLYVVGLAENRESAIELLQKILLHIVRSDSEGEIRKFFSGEDFD